MGNRTPVTLFPFLSVLIATMGVLSFIAITFLIFTPQAQHPAPSSRPVEVRWVGAPPHVRPLLVECTAKGARFHGQGGAESRFYPLAALEREAAVVKEMRQDVMALFGVTPDSQQFWLYMKEAIPQEWRLRNTLTTGFNALEIGNLGSVQRQQGIQRYPILLIFPDGLKTYQLVAFLVETTTRLSIGLEPMLEGWRLPYQQQAS